MLCKIVSLLFFAFLSDCQWAFLGGSNEDVNLGKYTSKSILPSGRYNFGFAFDGKEFYLIRGHFTNRLLCDLWALNIETMEWKVLGPSPDPLAFKGSSVDQGKFSSNNWPMGFNVFKTRFAVPFSWR